MSSETVSHVIDRLFIGYFTNFDSKLKRNFTSETFLPVHRLRIPFPSLLVPSSGVLEYKELPGVRKTRDDDNVDGRKEGRKEVVG